MHNTNELNDTLRSLRAILEFEMVINDNISKTIESMDMDEMTNHASLHIKTKLKASDSTVESIKTSINKLEDDLSMLETKEALILKEEKIREQIDIEQDIYDYIKSLITFGKYVEGDYIHIKLNNSLSRLQDQNREVNEIRKQLDSL